MEKEKLILPSLNLEDKDKEESESLQRLRSQILAKKELEQKLISKNSAQAKPTSSLYDELAKKAALLQEELDGMSEEHEEQVKVVSDNQDLIAKIESLEELVSRLEEKNALLEEKANEFSEDRIEGLKKEHEKEIAELKAKLDDALSSSNSNPSSSESLKEFIKTVEAKANAEAKKVSKAADKTVSGLKRQLEKVKENMTLVKSELTKANATLKKNDAKNAKLIEDLKAKLALANKEIEALKTNLKNTRVEVIAKVNSKDLEKKREKLEDEKRKIELLREKLEMEESYLKLFKQEIEEKYSEEIRSLKGKIAYLEKQPEKVVEVESADSEKVQNELVATLEKLAQETKKNALLEERIKELQAIPVCNTSDLEERDAKISELMKELEDAKAESEKAISEADKKVEEISNQFHELVAFLEEHKDAMNDNAEASALQAELEKEMLVEKELYKLIEEKNAEIKRLREEKECNHYAPYPPYMFAFPPQNPDFERELKKKDDFMNEMQKKYEEQIKALQERIQELELTVSQLKNDLAFQEDEKELDKMCATPIEEKNIPEVEPDEDYSAIGEEEVEYPEPEYTEYEPVYEEEGNYIERIEEPQTYIFSNDYLNKLNNLKRTKDILNEKLADLESQKQRELSENERLQAEFAKKIDDINMQVVSMSSSHDLGQDNMDEETYQHEIGKLYADLESNNALYQKLALDGVNKINIKYSNLTNEVRHQLEDLEREEQELKNGKNETVKVIVEEKKEEQEKDIDGSLEKELVQSELEEELENGYCPFPTTSDLNSIKDKNIKTYDELSKSSECQTYAKALARKHEISKKLDALKESLNDDFSDDEKNTILNEISSLTLNLQKVDSLIDDLLVSDKVQKYVQVSKKIDDINNIIKD